MAVGVLSRRECAGALGVLLTGCGRQRRRRIAVIPKSVSHLFWVSVEQGAAKAGKEFSVDILWNGPASETDFTRQVQIVESMVAQRVDAIALAAAERQALVGPVERAIAAGIPVSVFDSGLDSTNYVSFVATDNVAAGRMAARKIAEMTGGAGEIGVVMHAPGSRSSMDREEGFSDTIKREFPNLKIVASQYGMSDAARARAAAENILTAHPDLLALFASAEPSSIGAALAIKARGLENKVNLVAFDTSEAMVEDLRSGVIDALVVQDPERMGYEAVRTLVMKLEGKTPPKRVDLEAVLVERRNLDEANVKRLLHLR